MRFSKTLGLAAALVAAASFTACKSTTAEGNAGAGASGTGSMSADGGMGMSADSGGMGGAASDMGAAAGKAGGDMKAGADKAGADMSAGASSAAAGAADAGMQAANSAGSTMSGAADSAAAGASGAAGDAKKGASDSASGSSSGAADSAKGSGPTDPQIAAIVVAANTVDIDAAKLAMKSSKNAKVKKFAKSMIKDHTANNKAAVALVTKLGVTPEDNDTSKSLTDGGQKNIDNLKTLKGKDFDKAYVDNEVTYHQAVIDAIDNTLIPNAKNEDLKALLTKTSPVVKAHLDHAKMLQSSMGGAQ